MKLSYSTLATPGLGAEKSIKLARKYGYEGIDLRISDRLGELTENSTEKEIREVRNILDSEGIQAAGIMCYNKAPSEDPSSWQGFKDTILRHLDMGASLGAQSIRLGAGNPNESKNREDFLKRVAETFASVLEKDDSGVSIYIQNYNKIFTVAEFAELVRMVDNPRFGLVFSPEHCVVGKEDFQEVFSLIKEIAGQMYVCDIVFTETGHTDILPGKGVVPMEDCFRALGGKDFKGWITFKWEKLWNQSLEDADVALPYFINYMKETMEKISSGK